MNTLLDIGRAVAVEVGLEVPSSLTDNDPDSIKLRHFINEAGMEIARRVDWHVQTRTLSISGTGSNAAYPLATDHARLEQGLSVTVGGLPVRGGLTADEWAALTPTSGTPRYFLATSSTIRFYPFPAGGQTVTVTYQSKDWAVDNNGTRKPSLTADTDQVRLQPLLFVRGAVWRWMRHVGRDFNDQMAEFEAQLGDYASAEGSLRLP